MISKQLWLSVVTTEFGFPTELYITICAVLSVSVLLGIYFMSNVKRALLGHRISAVAMLLGIITTLVYNKILPVWLLYVSMAIGIVIGMYITVKVKMIQMPQLVALLNGLGGLSSAIVGAFALAGIGTTNDVFSNFTSSFAIAIGIITFIGSLVAAGKLHRILPQKPIVIKGHMYFTSFSLVVTIGFVVASCIPAISLQTTMIISALVAASLVFGILFSIRVGGADMPITISLLNSFSGVAAAIAGLAISDILLVAIGGIVGASGLLLTQIMCKAMNRSLVAILFGKKASGQKEEVKNQEVNEKQEHKVTTPTKDIIEVLKEAKTVIIVPGYGMAIAQAQHLVKQLQDKLASNGATIKYAVHPVAGRMPGHMNVLLCEANVDYEDLYEMDDINDEFAKTDVTLVIGANDVLNPAARNAEGTPIYGMPILDVDKCPTVVIFNYDLKPGYAGVENPLYHRENGIYQVLGDASKTLAGILEKLNQ